MKINKAFKFRIYPNQEQLTLIHKTFGCVRFTYNYFLNQRVELYKTKKNQLLLLIKLKNQFDLGN